MVWHRRRCGRGVVLTDVELTLVRGALELAMDVAREGDRSDPPVRPPRGIEPLLSFRRLPTKALATVAKCIDEEAEFRDRVTAAADELDEASRLFLRRPTGWRDELGALAARRESEAAAVEERRAPRHVAIRRSAVAVTPRRHAGLMTNHDETADAVLRIDCDDCLLQNTSSCDDCVVTFLCDHPRGHAVTIDLAEERALRMMADAGLAPGLRHVRRLS